MMLRRVHLDNVYENDNILVNFVGDHHTDRYWELGYHKNSGYEICLVHAGKGIFKIDSDVYPAVAGQLFMTRENQLHACYPSKENPYRLLYICFHIKTGASTHPWDKICRALETISFPVANDSFDMSSIHLRLIDEILLKKEMSEDMIESLVKQFIILTLRNYQSVESAYPHFSIVPRDSLSIQVIGFINTHIENKLDLSTLSEALSYSVPYICKKFKQQTGFTVMSYYNTMRMEWAKKFLLQTGFSISEISQKLSFSSIHSFSKAFKSVYGTSPHNFRKK